MKDNAIKDNIIPKKICLIIPCLDISGAISALEKLIPLLSKDYYIDLYSETDGIMRCLFEDKVNNIIISDTIPLDDYDMYFVNTLLCGKYISQLNNTNSRVLWWLHEAPIYFNYYSAEYTDEFWNSLSDNITIISAGQVVHDHLLSAYSIESAIINFCVPDLKDLAISDGNRIVDPNRTSFLCAATAYIPIKGQDLLSMAIVQLPSDVQKNCDFYFVADPNVGSPQIYEIVLLAAKACSNVYILPALEHESLLQLMSQVDVIIAPSRQDATNSCIVEGLAMGKITLSSTSAGISRYIKDGFNGFIFPSEDIPALIQKICNIASRKNELSDIKINAYNVYKENFSEEVFTRSFLNYL